MKYKTNIYYEPIGLRIKSARKRKNFTQEYVAEKLNVSCQHISDIERGINGLSVPSLIEFCKILEISADYILFGTSNNHNPIIEMISKMTPQQTIYAEEIITSYAKACGIKQV